MIRRMIYLLARLLPAPLRRLLKRTAQPLLALMVPVYLVQSDRLRLCIIGDKTQLSYTIRRLFGELIDPLCVKHVPAWRLASELDECRRVADLVLLDLPRAFVSAAIRRQTLQIPQLVQQDLMLPKTTEELEPLIKNNSSARDLRRIKQSGYTYELVHDLAFLREFYDDFYRPFVEQRHEEIAYVAPFETLQRTLNDGELLMVRDGEGRYISGSLNQVRNGTYCQLQVGVQGADPALVKDGAIVATYYFSFIEAIKKGCRQAGLGRSESFLNDGILFFKRKWGPTASPWLTPGREYRLGLGNLRPSTIDLLADNPFILLENGRLAALIVLGSMQPTEDAVLSSLLRGWDYPGIARQYVIQTQPDGGRVARVLDQLGGRLEGEWPLIDLSAERNPTPDQLMIRMRNVSRAPGARSGRRA